MKNQIILFVFFFLNGLLSFAQTISFIDNHPPSFASGGAGPYGVEKADFNMDGKLDLVVVNNSANNLSIYIGNGDGKFGAPVNYALGTSPRCVAVADFNKDGKIDLAATNYSSNNYSILLGNGDGTFQTAVNTSIISLYPIGIIATDLNNDNNPDLAIALNYNGTVVVCYGNGNGTFATPQNYNIPNSKLVGITSGDFNKDGKIDLAVGDNYYSTGVSILYGNSAGTFDPPVGYPVNNSVTDYEIYNIKAYDLNNDSNLDLVMSANPTLVVLYGTGNASTGRANFSASVPFGKYTSSELVLDDFNKDGQIDAAEGWPLVSVFIGNNGGFASPISFLSGSTVTGMISGDFDMDGQKDLITSNNISNDISFLKGNGDGKFNATKIFQVPDPLSGVVEDFNHDNKLDLATPTWTAYLSLNYGKGIDSFTVNTDYSSGNTPNDIAKGDFDGDGILDLITVPLYNNEFYFFKGKATGDFNPGVSNPATGSKTGVASADFNLDGKLDLAISNGPNNNVSVLLGNGNGTFATEVNYTVGTYASSVVAADFNSDGKFDIGVLNRNTNNVSILMGVGNGTFTTAVNYATGGTNANDMAVGDFNGDNKIDIAACNRQGANLSILINNGNGTFKSVVTYTTGITTSNLGAWISVGDFNKDGKPDIVYTVDYYVVIFQNNGNGTFTYVNKFAAGSPDGFHGINVGDFNSDGQLDIVGMVQGGYYLLLNNTLKLPNPTITFNSNSKIYGDAPFSMTATSNSTGAMVYSITSGSSFATINNTSGQITILGAGTVTVLVSQSATGTYAAATQTAILTISKAALTATADPKSRMYLTANPSFTISYLGFANGDTISALTSAPIATTTATTTSNAGTYQITLSGGAAANYNFTLVNGNLTITQATPSITYTGPKSGTVGTNITVAAATSSTSTPNFSEADGTGSATLSGTSLTLNTQGTVTVTISVSATTNYTAASISQTITISSLNVPSIFFKDTTLVFGDAPFDMTAISNSSGTMKYTISSGNTFASIDSATGQVTILGAGSVIVNVNQTASGSYSIGTKTAKITINKANPTLAYTGETSGNTGTSIILSTSTNSEAAPNYSISNQSGTATLSGNNLVLNNSGTVLLTISVDSTANFNANSITKTIMINALVSPTVNINFVTSGNMGDVIPLSITTNSTGTVSYSESNGSGSATLNGTQLILNSPGTITISTIVASDGTYAADTVTKTITINNVTSVIGTIESGFKVYPSITEDYATLEIKNLNIDYGTITIIDMKGYEISNIKYYGESEVKINSINWPSGTYIIKLHTTNGDIITKMIRQ